MRAEVVKQVSMAMVVPVLLVVILVTPSLMGRPTPLSAIPALIIGLTEDEVVLDVHGAVDQYRYATIHVHVQGQDNLSFNWTEEKRQAYDLDRSFPRNDSRAFDLYVLITDRQRNTYALNGTVFWGQDSTGDYIAMTDRGTWRTTLVYTPSDLRALIPRGVGP